MMWCDHLLFEVPKECTHGFCIQSDHKVGTALVANSVLFASDFEVCVKISITSNSEDPATELAKKMADIENGLYRDLTAAVLAEGGIVSDHNLLFGVRREPTILPVESDVHAHVLNFVAYELISMALPYKLGTKQDELKGKK